MQITTKVTAQELSQEIFPEIYKSRIFDHEECSEFFYMLDNDLSDGMISISKFRPIRINFQQGLSSRHMTLKANKDHLPYLVVTFDTRWSINDRILILDASVLTYSSINAAFVLLSMVKGDEDKICNELVRSCLFRDVSHRQYKEGE